VNNAGILHMAPIEMTDSATFERVIRINQLGTFIGMRSVLPGMKKLGYGSIVNIASIDAMTGTNKMVIAYGASKWAIRGMSKIAAMELANDSIRVNTVCPDAGGIGMIKEFLDPSIPDETVQKLCDSYTYQNLQPSKNLPLKPRTEEIALMCVFLASDESTGCTGGDFAVDGGATAGKLENIPQN